MPYGFYIRNSDNRVVVDDTFYTLQVLRTGTLNNWSSYLDDYEQAIPRQDDNSLIFFNGTNGKKVTGPVLLNARVGYRILSNNTAPINYAEVVLSSYFSKSASGYGLEVFDANGNLTFTSTRDLVARGNFHVMPGTSGTGYVYPSQSFSDTADNNWWTVLGGNNGALREIGNTTEANSGIRNGYIGSVERVNSTTYRASWLRDRVQFNLPVATQATHIYSQIRFITAKGL